MTAADELRLRRRTARLAGALYLAYFALSVLSEVLGHLTMGDAPTIAATAATQPGAFRVAVVASLACALVFAAAAWALHALLRPVHPGRARLFLLLHAFGVAAQSAATLHLAALWLRPGVDAALYAELYRSGYVMAQLFFGAWLLPLGLAVLASRFLPRSLGVLLLADCAAILTWFAQFFLFPAATVILYPCWAIGLVAELSLTLWLVARGARPTRA